eukprot:scaffold111448_cov34-Prasinocladus_malaysianus.AAC.1
MSMGLRTAPGGAIIHSKPAIQQTIAAAEILHSCKLLGTARTVSELLNLVDAGHRSTANSAGTIQRGRKNARVYNPPNHVNGMKCPPRAWHRPPWSRHAARTSESCPRWAGPPPAMPSPAWYSNEVHGLP